MQRREPQPSLDVPKSRELLEALLTVEGSVGNTYSRFHNYSQRNLGFLAMQGCPMEPVATYGRWQELGRHVTKGQKAYSILRPIQVKIEREESDEVQMIRRFKVVRALFALSQTAGEELPPYEPPEWSKAGALGKLAITEVPFKTYQGNVAGYSFERNVAVNPMALYPFKTLLHEMAHVVGGHTEAGRLQEYQTHRGVMEFEAEAPAYLVLNELDSLEQCNASESRAYVQGWMRDETPPESSFRTVLNTTDQLLQAGYEPAPLA